MLLRVFIPCWWLTALSLVMLAKHLAQRFPCEKEFSQLIFLNTLDTNQLSHKDQSATSWNWTHRPLSVPELRWDSKLSFLADAHIEKALIPATLTISKFRALDAIRCDSLPLDHSSFTNGERKWCASIVRRIELCPIRGECATVVDIYMVTRFGLSCAGDIWRFVLDDQTFRDGKHEAEESQQRSEYQHDVVVFMLLCILHTESKCAVSH